MNPSKHLFEWRGEESFVRARRGHITEARLSQTPTNNIVTVSSAGERESRTLTTIIGRINTPFGDESFETFIRMARRGEVSHSDIEQFNRFVRARRGHITEARLLMIQQRASPSSIWSGLETGLSSG